MKNHWTLCYLGYIKCALQMFCSQDQQKHFYPNHLSFLTLKSMPFLGMIIINRMKRKFHDDKNSKFRTKQGKKYSLSCQCIFIWRLRRTSVIYYILDNVSYQVEDKILEGCNEKDTTKVCSTGEMYHSHKTMNVSMIYNFS